LYVPDIGVWAIRPAEVKNAIVSTKTAFTQLPDPFLKGWADSFDLCRKFI
jgi:hypothetical protein